MANSRKKISELPALSVASLDTTFVLGISGSTTYKISINNLTSSLDTTFATDLVTNALSSSLNSKLSTSSFNSYTSSFTASVASGTISGSSQLTSSFDTRYVVSGSITQTTWDNIANKPSGIVSQSTDLSSLNTFTASISTASLVNRLNAIESVSGSWITESETGSFLTSLNGAISSSTQISDLGFVTGSYTTINSFNSLTQSFNSISQSFNVISGSVGTIDFSTLATTGSNTFIGNQTITGSVGIRANSGSWNFRTDGTLVLPNGTGIYGNGLLQVDTVGGFLLTSYTDQIGGGSQEWYFHSDGILNVPGNIEGADNLLTTSSFNSYTASQSTSSLVNRLNAIENVSGSWITESETGSLQTSITNLNTFTASVSTASLVTSISNLNSATSSYLTSLSGAISSSSQLTSSFDTRYAASGSVGSSVNTASLATTGSNSFNGNQTITGSLVVGSVAVVNGGITIPTGSVITLTSGSSISVDASGTITSLGGITGSIAATNGVISGSSQLTTSFPSKTTGNWTVPAGASTQSFSVESGASYTMWVNGNIPNGIITWNATVTTSNTNVPVVGFQYGWYYTAGNALVLTSMPDQIVGTNGSIVTSPASYAPNTSNVFKFGITNNSGTSQTINYGYIKLS